jgi:hypothetical protein
LQPWRRMTKTATAMLSRRGAMGRTSRLATEVYVQAKGSHYSTMAGSPMCASKVACICPAAVWPWPKASKNGSVQWDCIHMALLPVTVRTAWVACLCLK